jgi:hypothetical protein
MIKRGKAKSLGLEMSTVSQELMRREIVDHLEVFLKNENLGVQAHAAALMLFYGKSVKKDKL